MRWSHNVNGDMRDAALPVCLKFPPIQGDMATLFGVLVIRRTSNLTCSRFSQMSETTYGLYNVIADAVIITL